MKVAVVADTHIREKNNEYFMLINLLEKLSEEKIDYIILLGDIFEFYCDKKENLSEAVEEFINFIKKLNSKTEVILIEGNHEFGSSIGVRVEPLQWKLTLNNREIIFTHGDLIASFNFLYPFLRTLLHSRKIANFICKFFPSNFLWKIALKISDNSRKNGKIDGREVNRRIKKFFLLQSYISLVAAHSHRGFVMKNGKNFLLVTGAWYNEHSYAIISEKKVIIKKWEKK